jgi:shikimate kinase
MMKRIFLVGYMGSGKTTIGRELSKKLGFEFIDTDIYIENRFHKTINEIFATMGEEKFREIETNILKEVSDFENVIIAAGGGTPCFNNNMEIMKEKGTVIFLNPDLDELTYRLNLVKATRPLIKDKTEAEMRGFTEKMLASRMPFYEQAHFSTDGNLETGAEDIIKKLVNFTQNF